METSALQLPSAARFLPKGHSRTISRSPTRPRLTDDILSDLSPQTTLEAFTSVSGTLKASIETASPTQRAFGIRAAIASKNIHEWADELVSWPWPASSCQGFEVPAAKRRKLSNGYRAEDVSGSLKDTIRHDGSILDDDEYWGCLPVRDVIRYETRVEEILEDMDDLDVEAIKRQILDTHILPKTRPSSGLDQQPTTLSVTSYTAMDDFTAIVTATVLQALPKLSHLIGLMNIWSVRLAILRQVPFFMRAMADTEAALKRGWEKLRVFSRRGVEDGTISHSETPSLPRADYETMRDSLQDKVAILGWQIDQMLDSLEGRQDTLPEAWLDRMEAIEKDYGEWSVRGERKVREGEWAKDAAQQLKKKKLPASTVAEAAISDTTNNPRLTEDHQQPIKNCLLLAEDLVRPTGNDPIDTESSAESVDMSPPTENNLQKSENLPHIEIVSRPSTPIARQAQLPDATPPAQSQPVQINTQILASGSRQRNGSSPLSRNSSTSEAEIKPRRSRPFQAGFSWYLAHGEAGITPHVASTKPIAEDLVQASKSSIFDGIEDIDQLNEEESSHSYQKDDTMRLKSAVKSTEPNAEGIIDSTTADQLLPIPVFSPLLTDERLRGLISQEDVPADLSSSTDGIFEEVDQSKISVPRGTISSVDRSTSANSLVLPSSSKSSKPNAIESYPKNSDSEPLKGGVVTPPRPARIPRFGSGFANFLRQQVPLTVLPADDNTSPYRSSSTVNTGAPRIKEADAQARSQSSVNRSVVFPPDDGQTPAGLAISPASIESVASIIETSEALQLADRLIMALPLEATSTEQLREGFRPYKLSKALPFEGRADLHSENESSLGSSVATIQPAEYTTATADKGFDFSETAIASIGDSSAKLPIDITATKNPPLQSRLAPSKQVEEGSKDVASELLLTDFSIAQKSMVPVGAMFDDRNRILPTIELLESRKLVTPASLPTDSLDSNMTAISTALIADSPPPNDHLESYDPLNDVPHNNEPVNDNLLVDKLRGPRGPQADLPRHVVSRTDGTESITKPLVAAGPLPKVHEPLDSNLVDQSDPDSIAVSSAVPNDSVIAVVPTASTPAISSMHHFVPPTNVLAESNKAPSTLPTPVSVISNHSMSKLTPEMLKAEDNEYSRPTTPVEICHVESAEMVSTLISTMPVDGAVVVPSNGTNLSKKDIGGSQAANSRSKASVAQTVRSAHEMTLDSSPKCKVLRGEPDDHTVENPSHNRNSSIASVLVQRSNEGLAGTPPENNFSNTSPTMEATNSVTATPIMVLSPDVIYELPTADRMSTVSMLEYDEDSPSIRRMRPQDGYSPPGSPLLGLHVSKHRVQQLDTSHSFESDPSYPDSPEPLAEAPLLSNVEVSPAPPPSNATKTSDDQLQQQISEILESIPARIKLTSEPETTRISRIPKLKKQTSRPSLNPYVHPISRAPTPSFTLAPAYAKNPRPRPQNGNPEIKLYHLSRSTGEAPIKLFVRLVGENGERVMVRVGGGWADLGEYLKEYASHHGRRSDKDGKVEIQDLPPRVVSTGSNASTIRNGAANQSGQCSPASRPASSLDRPVSSLAIRKTRKSVGEDARERGYRSPSTPLPNSFRSSPTVPRALETPPSAASRSVSRMSWTEDESALGLAGPKSRKVEISAENAAWVESMKEKVRIASAEKEKEKKPDFGEMDRVGATKRLFKKGG